MFFIFLNLLLSSLFLVAINSKDSGYQINANSNGIVRDVSYDEGYRVDNSNSLAVFVPTRTKDEYDKFVSSNVYKVVNTKLIYNWDVGSWSSCTASASWGSWGSCDTDCGSGTKSRSCYSDSSTITRTVKCKNQFGDIELDSWCTRFVGAKPSTSGTCWDYTCSGSSSKSCSVAPSCGSKPECPSGCSCSCSCSCSGWACTATCEIVAD